METITIFVFAILISAYLVLGGLLFQRFEQPQQAQKDSTPIVVINLTHECEVIAAKVSSIINGEVKPSAVDDHEHFGSGDDLSLTPQILGEFILRSANRLVEEISPKEPNGSSRYVATLVGDRLIVKNRRSHNEDWDFYGSFFFAAITITTIGYGDIAPKSEFGKLLALIYAIIGIPLVAAFLGGLSDRIRQISQRIENRVPLDQLEKQSNKGACCFCCVVIVKISVVFLIGASIFLVLPAWLFQWKEETWTFTEGLYFSFITLSTIGYGDYIPARNPEVEDLNLYRMAIVLWVFVGLAWLSSVIGLIQGAITTYSESAVNQYVKAIALENADENLKRALEVVEESNKELPKPDFSSHQSPKLECKANTSTAKSTPTYPPIARVESGLVHHAAKPDRHNTPYIVEAEDADTLSEISILPPPRNRRQVLPRSRSTPSSYNNSPVAVPPVAAAMSTTPMGDTYAVMSMLPQMMQMAMAANNFAGGNGSYRNPNYDRSYRRRPGFPQRMDRRGIEEEFDDAYYDEISEDQRRRKRTNQPPRRYYETRPKSFPMSEEQSDGSESPPVAPIRSTAKNKPKKKPKPSDSTESGKDE